MARQSFQRIITEEEAYIKLLDTNTELRKELAEEIANNKISNKKLNALNRKLDSYYRTLSHQDSTIIAHEDEIASLKSEIKSLKQHLQKALQDLRHKGNASTVQDIHILRLEDKVDQLKKRIREITDKKLLQNNNLPMALPGLLRDVATALDRVENYIGGDTSINPINTLNGIRITLTTVRDHMQRVANEAVQYQNFLNIANGHINYLMNDITNTRNEILRRDQMMTQAWRDERRARQAGDAKIIELRRSAHRYINDVGRWRRRHTACTQQAQNLKRYYQQYKDETDWESFWTLNKYQKWKARELNSRQIILNLQNNPLGNMAGIQDVTKAMALLLAREEPYIGQEAPDEYFNRINQILTYGDTLGVGGFDGPMKTNVLASKMAGRFIPPNPFNNAGGVLVNTPALFQQWLRDTYQTVMIGANRTSLKALNHEKFDTRDSPETYKKRIKPYAQDIPFADALPYLYDHLPNKLSVRMRMIAPADLNAYFQNLRTLWLECGGQIWEESEKPPAIQQISPSSRALAIQPQKDDFKIRLAKDLAYSGIVTDDATLEKFIYEELQKRLGGRTAHVRKSSFAPRSAYATKKVVRKVTPKTSSKLVRHCSVCGKAGHTKVNCPRLKRTKKVNHIYQEVVEDPENSEEEYIEEYIVEEEVNSEEEEIEEVEGDEEEYDDNESRNCYAVKKKWDEVEYL